MPRGLSDRAHHKVLDAATGLFAERGIDATSMDAIASASGVSKATVYKHWADKEALCLEVLMHVHRFDTEPPEFDSGDLKKDLKAFLGHEPSAETAGIRKRLMPHLLAYSARNQEFGRAWRSRVAERVHTGLRKLLRRGIEAGVFPAVLDEELSIALLLGPMMYRHIFGPTVDREWLVEGVVETFWKANARVRPEKAVNAPKPRAVKAKKRSGARGR
jgi:AcrR family transcriptional regulator